MKPFLTLDESLIDPSLPIATREDYFQRDAARAVVFDDQGAVAVLHVKKDAYYKLPGGGIEPGEDIQTALEREMLEEIGCSVRVLQEVGIVLEQRYYFKMTQVSHCFIATVVGEKGKPNFTQEELDDGFEIVWAKNIDEAITLLEYNGPTVSEPQLNIAFMCARDSAIAKRVKALARD